MPLTVLNGPTIGAGQSLSDVLDCTSGQLVRLTMPARWSDAVVTFQLSTDGIGFNDLYDSDGREIAIPVIGGAAYLVPAYFAGAIAFIKFRSGSTSRPITQAEQRTFAVAVKS